MEIDIYGEYIDLLATKYVLNYLYTGVPRLTRFLVARFHFTRILDLSKSQIL